MQGVKVKRGYKLVIRHKSHNAQTSLINNEGIWAIFFVVSDMFQDVIHVYFKSSKAKQATVQ